MWHWGYGSWWMGLMMVLFWAGAAALIIWTIRNGSQRTHDDGGPRALDVLDERYAKGEIDDDEYRRRRDMLQQR